MISIYREITAFFSSMYSCIVICICCIGCFIFFYSYRYPALRLPLIGNTISFIYRSRFLKTPHDAFMYYAKVANMKEKRQADYNNHQHTSACLLHFDFGFLRHNMLLVNCAACSSLLLSGESFKGPGYDIFRSVTPNHLPGLDGKDAITRRRTIIHAMHRPGMEDNMLMLINNSVKEMIKTLNTHKSNPVVLNHVISVMSWNVIFSLLFGTIPSHTHRVIYECVRVIMEEWHIRLTELIPLHKLRQRTLVRAKETLKIEINNIMEIKTNNTTTTSSSNCVIDTLLLNINDYTDTQYIHDIVFTMLAMGHENISTSLTWMILLLANNPDIQNKCRKEITDCNRISEKELDTISLPYLTAVIYETLRLYPPIPMLSRIVKHDPSLHGIKIKSSTEILICPYVLHRSSLYWSSPDKFLPERWLDTENGYRLKYSPHVPGSYLPFGLGSRACVGYQLSIMEARVTLIELISTYYIEPIKKQEDIQTRLHVSLKPEEDISVYFIPIKK